MRLFLILLLSSPALWSIQIRKISQHDYARNITPQLKSIISEYYSVIKNIEPNCSKKLQILEIYNTLVEKLKLLKEQCPQNINFGCKKNLTFIYYQLVEVEQKILEEYRDMIFDFEQNNQFIIDTINVQGLMVKIQENRSLLEIIQLELILHRKSQTLVLELEKKLAQLNHLLHKFLIETLPSQYRFAFWKVHTRFIMPTEKYYLYGTRSDLFYQNIHELNFIWNEFLSTLTKKIYPPPTKSEQTLNTMHRRWNQILKTLIK